VLALLADGSVFLRLSLFTDAGSVLLISLKSSNLMLPELEDGFLRPSKVTFSLRFILFISTPVMDLFSLEN
jgi:hypothetical protein